MSPAGCVSLEKLPNITGNLLLHRQNRSLSPVVVVRTIDNAS